MPSRVQVIHETRRRFADTGWTLCFQWCQYVYDNGTSEHGYRFIWRSPENDKQQPHRGQARIPSIPIIKDLIKIAENEGWGNLSGE
jgi:hypothetical protein